MRSRVALVTGGGSGIGAGVARELADLGHRVAVLDRTENAANEVADQIRASGGTAMAVHADVSDPDEVASAVNEIKATLGPIGILVNNAGSPGTT